MIDETDRVVVLPEGVVLVAEENTPAIPATWCVTVCDDCDETWTVDSAEHTPVLTDVDAAQLCLAVLLDHTCTP